MHRLLVSIIVIQFVALVALALALFRDEEPASLEPRSELRESEAAGNAGERPRRSPGDQVTEATFADDGATEADSQPAPADAPIGTVLYGSLTDLRGAPLDAQITLTDADETSRFESGKEGRYAIAGLRPGPWHCEVKADGHRKIEADFEIGGEPTRRLDFVLDPAVIIKVKVLTPDGEPLEPLIPQLGPFSALIAVATAEPPAGDLPMTPIRSQDRYGLGEFQAGRGYQRRADPMAMEYIGQIELAVDLPVHVSLVLRHLVIATTRVDLGSDEVEFRVALQDLQAKMSSFRVKLVDAATGDPITKARIDISDRQSSSYGLASAQDGVYLKEKLRPGLMTLSIDVSDYGSINHYVMLESGKTLDLGTLRLQAAATIKGQVLDAEGKACPAKITVCNLDEMTFPQPLDLGMSWSADADGYFEIKGRVPGRHRLRARTESGGLAEVLVDVAAGATIEKDIHVRSATKVKMVNKIGNSDYLLIRIVDAAGQPVWARHLWGASTRELDLLPGSYRLEIYRDLDLLRSEDFRVGSDSAVTLNVP